VVINLQREIKREIKSKEMTTAIVVFNLTHNVTTEHVKEIFGAYGQITDAFMPVKRESIPLPFILISFSISF
jgi:RNA recognition motif-containing protein